MLSICQDSSRRGVSHWVTNWAAKIARAHLIYRTMEALCGLMRSRAKSEQMTGHLRLVTKRVYFDLFQHTRVVIIKHTGNKCW